MQKAAGAQREYEHKQKLIDQAKAAYARAHQPPSAVVATSGASKFLFLVINMIGEL